MSILSELEAPADRVAPALLGWKLVSTVDRERCVGQIVETEAYLGPNDPASHAAVKAGRTVRNAPMFGPAGSVYVYRSYGIHWCFNVVTGAEGSPQAVLVRALDPCEGLPTMARRRGREDHLADGPGRLAQALGIDAGLNGHLLDYPPLRLVPGDPPGGSRLRVTPRIGIRRGRDLPLRFVLEAGEARSAPHPVPEFDPR